MDLISQLLVAITPVIEGTPPAWLLPLGPLKVCLSSLFSSDVSSMDACMTSMYG